MPFWHSHFLLGGIVCTFLLFSSSYSFQNLNSRDAWVAQSVKHPTSAQVTISQSVSLSPASGAMLTAQSLEPASDSVSLSPCPSLLILCLSLTNKNKQKKFKNIFFLGAPGWLSWLSIWLQLRSRSQGLWVGVLYLALCWQLRAWSLLWSLGLPLYLPLPHSRSVSFCLKNKYLMKNDTESFPWLHLHFLN